MTENNFDYQAVCESIGDLTLNIYDVRDYLDVLLYACREKGYSSVVTVLEQVIKEQNIAIRIIDELRVNL